MATIVYAVGAPASGSTASTLGVVTQQIPLAGVGDEREHRHRGLLAGDSGVPTAAIVGIGLALVVLVDVARRAAPNPGCDLNRHRSPLDPDGDRRAERGGHRRDRRVPRDARPDAAGQPRGGAHGRAGRPRRQARPIPTAARGDRDGAGSAARRARRPDHRGRHRDPAGRRRTGNERDRGATARPGRLVPVRRATGSAGLGRPARPRRRQRPGRRVLPPRLAAARRPGAGRLRRRHAPARSTSSVGRSTRSPRSRPTSSAGPDRAGSCSSPAAARSTRRSATTATTSSSSPSPTRSACNRERLSGEECTATGGRERPEVTLREKESHDPKDVPGTVLVLALVAATAAPAGAWGSGGSSKPGTIVDVLVAKSGTGGFDSNPRDYDILIKAVTTANLVGPLSDPAAQPHRVRARRRGVHPHRAVARLHRLGRAGRVELPRRRADRARQRRPDPGARRRSCCTTSRR